eukprot:5116674-Pyramimonas_sp.AAC.1
MNNPSRVFSLNFAVSLLISGLRHVQKSRAPNGMQRPSLRAATPVDVCAKLCPQQKACMSYFHRSRPGPDM